MRFSLRITNGKLAGREIPIRGPRFLIGCAEDCHLKIPATQVTLYHCALLVQDDGIWVRNYGSGVMVGGIRIVDRRRLNHGDEVQVGLVRFEMLIEDAPVKGNDRVPPEGESPDSQPVERSVTPVPEPTQLSNAPSESPDAPPGTQTAPATQEDLDQVQQHRLEQMEPASEVATDTLLQYFTCRNAHDDSQKTAPPISPKRKRPPWWMLVDADGEVNPNVMFVLGILVGIGLSTAANTFWMISGQPAATAPAAMVDGSLATADDGSLATADEEGETPQEE
ncbi:MAG TPA: FHA domain-containing protein [Pirellulales bacterium]|jgi:predicted component of type VI protein secretion system|nr:FHA domain-containing protein [Pirellulales bacterium]